MGPVPPSPVDLENDETRTGRKRSVQKNNSRKATRLPRNAPTSLRTRDSRLPRAFTCPVTKGLRVRWSSLIRLIQSTPEVITDKRRAAFALAVPGHLLKGQAILELPGPKAAVRLQQAMPTFYVQSSQGLGAKMELIPVKVVEESRIVERVEASRAGLEKASQAFAAVRIAAHTASSRSLPSEAHTTPRPRRICARRSGAAGYRLGLCPLGCLSARARNLRRGLLLVLPIKNRRSLISYKLDWKGGALAPPPVGAGSEGPLGPEAKPLQGLKPRICRDQRRESPSHFSTNCFADQFG